MVEFVLKFAHLLEEVDCGEEGLATLTLILDIDTHRTSHAAEVLADGPGYEEVPIGNRLQNPEDITRASALRVGELADVGVDYAVEIVLEVRLFEGFDLARHFVRLLERYAVPLRSLLEESEGEGGSVRTAASRLKLNALFA